MAALQIAGVVRAARRPSGWRAPGPRPRTPVDRDDVWPAVGEDLCHLAGDWRILQRVGAHRWSLDDLVTAWFAAEAFAAAPPARIADLGSGIGAVLLLLAWRFPAARCVGVEAQVESAALARRSTAWNGVAERCEVRVGDLRDPGALPEEASFDLVTGTPPYLPLGSGRVPRRPQQAGCHFEARGGIEAYCAAAARALNPSGWFVVCHAAGQRARAERAAAAAGLGIARRLDVVPRMGKLPLFSVYAMRHGDHGAARERVLVVRDRRGQWTPAFRRLRAAMGMPCSVP